MANGTKKVLIIGSGGREHALAWKLAQSPQVDHVFVAPGNGGTAQMAGCTNVPIGVGESEKLLAFAIKSAVNLTVVGPEAPLANGIVDLFQHAGQRIYGPSQKAAQLEASKAYAKAFMLEHGIPTAKAETFTEYDAASAYLDSLSEGGIVIKASGLAAGKGVLVCDSLAEARDGLREIMQDMAFGEAGSEVLIEERMSGPEVSVIALCDGKSAVSFLPARDHKRALDGDQGLNTGGMGAFAPPPDLDEGFVDDVMQTVIQPTLEGMNARGIPFVGVMFVGFMLTKNGAKVLEYNARFGDPETQVILPMLNNDLYELLYLATEGRLDEVALDMKSGACATVVMASEGYPQSYPKGLTIEGIEKANSLETVTVFHAGTKESDSDLVTSGGRVLAVSAFGDDLEAAINNAYAGVNEIGFAGAHYRTDIGKSTLKNF